MSRPVPVFASRRAAERGTVYLVGAGPGGPDLLTLRARDLIASCDVALYDHLVNPLLLDHLSPDADRIFVGKVGHGDQCSQEDIHQALIGHARKRLRVVRLKGGDPMLFGRGGEEAVALAAAGIPFEIVPGVSSALAVPAYAGIPVTYRGLSSSVAIVSGHCAEDCQRIPLLTAGAETVIVLMGIAHLDLIVQQLLDTGRSPSTPAAAIRWGTRDEQQTLTATLETLAHEIARHELAAPAVIVIGEVVRLRRTLAWSRIDSAVLPTLT